MHASQRASVSAASLALLLVKTIAVSGEDGTYCDGSSGKCFSRPSLVSESPQIHQVCDEANEGCFRVAAIPRARRGPSAEVRRGQWGERPYLKSLFDHILGGNCTRENGRRKIIVDVGANIGLYGLYFAARGCFVHFVEALPLNAHHIRFSISLNGFAQHARLHNVAVSAIGNRTIEMRYLPTDTGVSHAIYGDSVNSSTNGYFRKSSGNPAKRLKKWVVSQVPALRLEDIVHLGARNYVDFLKIDVEGAELEALCSSVGWFERLAVKNLGMELNWETTVQSQARIIESLLSVYEMQMRENERKIPNIAAVSFQSFYRHVAKMYMGLFEPRSRLTGRLQSFIPNVPDAAKKLCEQAVVMRSASPATQKPV